MCCVAAEARRLLPRDSPIRAVPASAERVRRGTACLVVVAHQGPAAVLGAQEPVHQHGPPEREMELDVLLKVRTQLVTVQVVAEGEALPRDEHVYLTPHRRRQEGFQTICQEQKRGESPSARRPCAAPVPSLGMEAMPAPLGTRTTAQERAWGAARASSERQGSAPRGSVQRLYTC